MFGIARPRPFETAALSAFRSRNYRLYFAGQMVSLVGTWMQRVAMGWLVYRLTASGFWLGAAEFSANFTSFLISPFAGVWSDRLPRRGILIATHALNLVQAGLLAALVLSGRETIPLLLALCLFQGIVNGFEFPTRHSFAVELVDRKEDLPSAIALNSFVFNLARLIGPAVAGVAIQAWGEGPCFLANALSYLPVILALLVIRPRAAAPPAAAAERAGVLDGLREGAAYALAHPGVRTILTLLSVVSVAGMSYLALLPMFVREALLGDATLLGRLSSAAGFGAIIGATAIALRGRVFGLETRVGAAGVRFGLSLFLLAFSRDERLLLPLLLVVGYESITIWVGSNTLLQTLVDDRMRGRVMSFFIMTFLGGAPVGSLLFGTFAGRAGVRAAFAAGALLCLFAGARHLDRVRRLRAATPAAFAAPSEHP